MQTLRQPQAHPARSPYNRYHRFGWQLLGFTLGALLAVGIAPGTGWLIRKQLALVTLPAPINDADQLLHGNDADYGTLYSRQLGPIKETAARFPNDVGVQAANAVAESKYLGYGNSERPQMAAGLYPPVCDLLVVSRRFPNSPLPCALALRYAMMQTGIHRPEGDYWLNANRQPKNPTVFKILSGDAKTVLEQTAQEGERLDPENAYFPTMLAVLHFAAYEDDAAVQDVRRASIKPRWNDYTSEEVQGRRRLREVAYGTQSALANITDVDSLLLPHYFQVREVARQIAWKAMLRERAGDIRGGVALRHAVMQIGITLRDQSRNLIGVAVGRAVFAEAASRPGGAQHPKGPGNEQPEQIQAQLLGWYTKYLHAHGQATEATWVMTQVQNDRLPHELFATQFYRLGEIGKLWAVDLLLLTEIGLFAALAGITAFLRYRRRFTVRPPSSLPVLKLWGLRMGLASSAGFLLYGLSLPAAALPHVALYVVGVGGLTAYAGLLWIIAPYVRVKSARPLLESLLKTVYAVVGGGCLLMLCLWSAVPYLLLMAWKPGSQTSFGPQPGTGELLSLFTAACVLPLPAIMGLCLAARVRRIPASFGIVQNFGKAAAPILTLLTLVYIGAAFATLQNEADTNARLARMVENEPRYVLSQDMVANPSSNGLLSWLGR